jgi:hypothetical protein
VNSFPVTLCIQAVLRPSILDKTLSSFCEKITPYLSVEKTVCNVDLVGERCGFEDVVKVVRRYFPDAIVAKSDWPCFTRAVITPWQMAETPYIFNLEDDWELLRPVDLGSMVTVMNHNPGIAALCLPRVPIKCNRFTQNPALIRRSWAMEAVKGLSLKESVEVQLQGLFSEWVFSMYPYYQGKPYIKDIGRPWRCRMGFKKPKRGFKSWIKTKS